MDALVWIGAAITLAGFVGIVWTLIAVGQARRRAASDEDLRERLHRLMPLNLGAFLLSVLGLVLVVVGVVLT